MTARAIYKGRLLLNERSIPVKLFSAVEDRDVHFRLLHESDGTPLKQRMIDPLTKHPVTKENIQRGYLTDEGNFVVLHEQEQEGLRPSPSREMEILRFVAPQHLNHQWYARPYFIGPDGSDEVYFALADVLAAENLEGVVRWVMRKREYRGALRVHAGYLVLIALRHAKEVVDASGLPKPRGRSLEPQERKMASQLVDMLAGEFDPAAYQDEYRQRLEEFLDKKLKGQHIKLAKLSKKRVSERSLAKALRASVEREKERKVA